MSPLGLSGCGHDNVMESGARLSWCIMGTVLGTVGDNTGRLIFGRFKRAATTRAQRCARQRRPFHFISFLQGSMQQKLLFVIPQGLEWDLTGEIVTSSNLPAWTAGAGGESGGQRGRSSCQTQIQFASKAGFGFHLLFFILLSVWTHLTGSW